MGLVKILYLYNFNINIVTPYKSTVRKPLFKLYYSMRSHFCFNRILAGVIALLLFATIFYACGKTTNDVAPSTRHVTLGWGRDYGDICPIKGVFIGGGQHTMRVSVDVDAV